MKKSDLKAKTIKELALIARKIGIKKPTVQRKDDLIAEIFTAQKLVQAKGAQIKKSTPRKPVSTPALKASASKATATKVPRSPTKVGPIHKARSSKAPPPSKEPDSGLPPFEHKFESPKHPIAVPPKSMESPYDHLGELPEAYGTGRLFLTARDPHWLFAYWDYTWQQMDELRRAAQNGEVKLRLHSGRDSHAPIHQEMTLPHAARNWHLHVNHDRSDFYAEVGFYDHHGQFVTVSRSGVARTPSGRISDRTEARFVTIPFHLSFRELFELVRQHFADGEELSDVLFRLQAAGFKFPFDYEKASWSGDSKQLLEMFGQDLFRRIRMGSEELTEWFKRRLQEETSSGLFSMSSPFGSSFGVPRNFWFEVNAELIVYGATDPSARVVFDGREIPLKQDGTFRFQFALPDGAYEIPITATSSDGKETLKADLHFNRETQREGDVGTVPHPPGLPVPPMVSLNKG